MFGLFSINSKGGLGNSTASQHNGRFPSDHTPPKMRERGEEHTRESKKARQQSIKSKLRTRQLFRWLRRRLEPEIKFRKHLKLAPGNLYYSCSLEFCHKLVNILNLCSELYQSTSFRRRCEKEDPTFAPPTRLGGSVTLIVSNKGVKSIPRSDGVTFSIFFFLAFMILGSDAYRGSEVQQDARVSPPNITSR